MSGTRLTIRLTSGLEGRDDDLEHLVELYEQLQLVSADIANPHVDLLTFASMAHYFGVIEEVPEAPVAESPPAPVGSAPAETAHSPRSCTFAPEPSTSRAGYGRDVDEEVDAMAGRFFCDENGIGSKFNGESGRAPNIWKTYDDDNYDSEDTMEDQELGLSDAQHSGLPHLSTAMDSYEAGTSSSSIAGREHETLESIMAELEGKENKGASVLYDTNHGNLHAPIDSDQYLSPTPYSPQSQWVLPPLTPRHPIVGFVYLVNSSAWVDYSHAGELNIGIYLSPKYRRNGYALKAVNEVLKIAFKDPHCNRVQAAVVDGELKHTAMSLFLKAGFGHEGTRRRAFRSPFDSTYRDVTYLGMLATDYVMRAVGLGRGTLRVAPASRWDELLARHQREREELLRWEEKQLKRSSSMETIRDYYGTVAAEPLTMTAPAAPPQTTPPAIPESPPKPVTDKGKGPASLSRKRRDNKNKKKNGKWNAMNLAQTPQSESEQPLSSSPVVSPPSSAASALGFEDVDMDDIYVPEQHGEQQNNTQTPLAPATIVRGDSPTFSEFSVSTTSESDAGSGASFSSSVLSSNWSVIGDDEDGGEGVIYHTSDAEGRGRGARRR